MRHLAIVMAMLPVLICGCGQDPRQRGDYIEIIEQIQKGDLAPDANGVVALPPKLVSASATGEAYVTNTPRGKQLIVLPTWRGKSHNIRGYLYCSLPLAQNDTSLDYYERKYPAVKVRLWRIPGYPEQLQRDLVEVVLVEKIAPNWYRISRSLD